MSSVRLRYSRPVRSGNNSTSKEKTLEHLRSFSIRALGSRKTAVIAAFVAILIVVGGFMLWFNKIYASPGRVFWSMISNNLSTYSVTKEIKENGTAANTDDFTQLVFSPQPTVRDIKEVSTAGSSQVTKVDLESVGTPKDNYQHYTLIDRPAAPGQAKLNYSSVYPLWLYNGGDTQTSASGFFDNAVFGVTLFGNLSEGQRQTTLNYLRKAYQVDFTKAQRQTENGRRIYVYSVVLSMKDYASAAHYYAKTLGLPDANQIGPDNYQSSQKLAFTMKVDVLSRQLKQITYNPASSPSSPENYSGYGILANINMPAHVVDSQTLEKAINAASQ